MKNYGSKVDCGLSEQAEKMRQGRGPRFGAGGGKGIYINHQNPSSGCREIYVY